MVWCITKTVYTVYGYVYGINAKDSCPVECGAKFAYEAGWFTPELAIKGGASFVLRNILVWDKILYIK